MLTLVRRPLAKESTGAWYALLVGVLLIAASGNALADDSATAVAKEGTTAKLDWVRQPFLGDLPELRKRRVIRVLVGYSKTNFFFEGGRPRGFEYELLSRYEEFLNHQVPSHRHTRLTFIPVPFDRLLPALGDGLGDIAAAGLTVTPARERLVAFSRPYLPDVREVVVLHRGLEDVNAITDLGGELIFVAAGTSYARHLRALSRELTDAGAKPLTVVETHAHLVTEDILELVNAGILPLTVADQHIAEAWARVLPDIVVRPDLVVHDGGTIAWAVRKGNPKLLASLNAFTKKHKKGSLVGNILFERYFQDTQWIKNPITDQEWKKLEKVAALFKKYADRYGFDWLALAAQAYQESELNNKKVNRRTGAVGIMQILPRTARDKAVNIKDVRKLENNIHAGVRYLAHLRDHYFDDPEMDPAARMDFVWAAYNAGPTKINQLRRRAKRAGFDPNQWFFNVERIAAQQIGRETVNYVANINKYYVAYKLQDETQRRRRAELEMLKAAPRHPPD